MEPFSHLERLPIDLIRTLTAWLDGISLSKLSATSRSWRGGPVDHARPLLPNVGLVHFVEELNFVIQQTKTRSDSIRPVEYLPYVHLAQFERLTSISFVFQNEQPRVKYDGLPKCNMVDLPRTLTKLRFKSEHGSVVFAEMPPKLTWLEIWSSNSFQPSEAPTIRYPPLLTHLRVYSLLNAAKSPIPDLKSLTLYQTVKKDLAQLPEALSSLSLIYSIPHLSDLIAFMPKNITRLKLADVKKLQTSEDLLDALPPSLTDLTIHIDYFADASPFEHMGYTEDEQQQFHQRHTNEGESNHCSDDENAGFYGHHDAPPQCFIMTMVFGEVNPRSHVKRIISWPKQLQLRRFVLQFPKNVHRFDYAIPPLPGTQLVHFGCRRFGVESSLYPNVLRMNPAWARSLPQQTLSRLDYLIDAAHDPTIVNHLPTFIQRMHYHPKEAQEMLALRRFPLLHTFFLHHSITKKTYHLLPPTVTDLYVRRIVHKEEEEEAVEEGQETLKSLPTFHPSAPSSSSLASFSTHPESHTTPALWPHWPCRNLTRLKCGSSSGISNENFLSILPPSLTELLFVTNDSIIPSSTNKRGLIIESAGRAIDRPYIKRWSSSPHQDSCTLS